MTEINIPHDLLSENPLDIIEKIVEINEWLFDRRNDLEMAVQVPGTWCAYSLYFAWNEDMEAMEINQYTF